MPKIILRLELPEANPNAAFFTSLIVQQVGKEFGIMERLFKRSYANWQAHHKPKWNTRIDFRGKDMVARLFTHSDVYRWVSGGTRPHPIAARAKAFLRYQTGYRPKTRPGVLGSRAGGKFGPWARKDRVRHTGGRARLFHEEVADRRRFKVATNMQNALTKRGKGFFVGRSVRVVTL